MKDIDMIVRILKTAENISPGFSLSSISIKMKFLIRAFRFHKIIHAFCTRVDRAGYSCIFDRKQNSLGAVLWPYINKNWDPQLRLLKIVTHYEIIGQLPDFFSLKNGTPNTILNLNSISRNIHVCFDHPIWFMREGEVVLNLFKEDLRVVSIAFIFSIDKDHGQSIIIGAIQGIHRGISSEKSLSIFRGLTKDFAGLRPRSLLIEILRIVAKLTNTTKIYAIADENRQHRHKYFGRQENKKLLSDYNQIWREHGGVRNGSGFYDIPINPQRKELADIPSKKRSKYRRRNKILQFIGESLEEKFMNSPIYQKRNSYKSPNNIAMLNQHSRVKALQHKP